MVQPGFEVGSVIYIIALNPQNSSAKETQRWRRWPHFTDEEIKFWDLEWGRVKVTHLMNEVGWSFVCCICFLAHFLVAALCVWMRVGENASSFLLLVISWVIAWHQLAGVGFPSGVHGKELPANTGDVRDMGLIPGSGRSPEEGMATHCSILA